MTFLHLWHMFNISLIFNPCFPVRYPSYTTEEQLQVFRGDVTRGSCKGRFKAYCKRVMTTAMAAETQESTMPKVLQIDCLVELTTARLMQDVPEFTGAEIIFLDLPKVSFTVHS